MGSAELVLSEMKLRGAPAVSHRLDSDENFGRTVMNAALAHLRLVSAARIYLQVWHRNERAIRLYESLGFGVVGTTTFRIGVGELAEDLVMLRS